jgi:hypothetical protein
LTFETPQFALLDAAHGALSVVEWPQPYWCTTLVHILARIGEEGALHSGERLLRAALRVVEEEGGVEGGRADWPDSRKLLWGSSQTGDTRGTETQQRGARLDDMQSAGAGRAGGAPAGVWQEMGWKLGLHKGQQRAGCGASQVARQLDGQPSKQ